MISCRLNFRNCQTQDQSNPQAEETGQEIGNTLRNHLGRGQGDELKMIPSSGVPTAQEHVSRALSRAEHRDVQEGRP